MEYRKLISFGKSSYVISLPKSWVNQNKLKKGDLVYLDGKDNDLILTAKDNDKSKEELKININVDGKPLKQIKREIIGAYIKNAKSITLNGNDIKDKAVELQPIIQNLVALEVMEQTSKKIVAKDFLNIDDVSTENIIRKMDVIVRSMFEDCENTFVDNTSENIQHRDSDVNKLTFLIFRIVKFGLDNPTYMIKKFNLRPGDLLNLWWLSFDLESIADELKRTSRLMTTVKLNKKKQEELKEILHEIRESYNQIMKAYITKDMEIVHQVINSRDTHLQKCENFYRDNKGVDDVAFLTDRIKAAITHVCHIGRLLYQ
jgi:phosphate uptake regulator